MDKISQVGTGYEGDPARYFFGVARNVFFEYTRRPPTVSFEEARDVPERLEDEGPADEEMRECLERCLGELDPDERHIIAEYYRYDKGAKISNRKELARSLGLGLNALRIKAFRIRKRIHGCVLVCAQSRNRRETS
jgi:DNA-directed RNA polymerase specialized sigma24 family protein